MSYQIGKGESSISLNTKEHSLVFLDAMRGLAAVYVMIGHARWLLWEGYQRGLAKDPDKTFHPDISFLIMGGDYFLSAFCVAYFMVSKKGSLCDGQKNSNGWVIALTLYT